MARPGAFGYILISGGQMDKYMFKSLMSYELSTVTQTFRILFDHMNRDNNLGKKGDGFALIFYSGGKNIIFTSSFTL